jgi:tyrosinase
MRGLELMFFLHHAQIDRLWWQWQQRDLADGLSLYGGSFKSKSERRAGLDDVILGGDLAPSVKVRDVMNIQSDFFC